MPSPSRPSGPLSSTYNRNALCSWPQTRSSHSTKWICFRTSADPPTALTVALPQYGRLFSLTSQACTGDFLAEFATRLEDRHSALLNLLQDVDSEDASASLITHAWHRAQLESALQFFDALLTTPGTRWILNIIRHVFYLTHRCLYAGVEDVVLGAEESRRAMSRSSLSQWRHKVSIIG